MCLILWFCFIAFTLIFARLAWLLTFLCRDGGVGFSWWAWSCWPSRSYWSSWTSWTSGTSRPCWRERRTGKNIIDIFMTYRRTIVRFKDWACLTTLCYIYKNNILGRERTSRPSWKRWYSGTCGSARTWRTSWTTWRGWRQGELLSMISPPVK